MIRFLAKRFLRMIPEEHRSELRRVFRLIAQGLRAIRRGRMPVKANRVVWLRREVADIESMFVSGPGKGEILVETEMSLISPGTERAFLLGMPNTRQKFPSGAGYSAAGRVAMVGRGVSDWQLGRRVAGVAPHASHVLVKASDMVPIPDSVPPEIASFTQLGAIALHGVRRANIAAGNRVVVIGAGIIGQLSIQLARWAGAVPVVAMARTGTFEEHALKSGCDEFVELGSRPRATDTIDADVVIEATGNPEAIHTACRSAREGGRVVLVGSSRGATSDVGFERLIRSRNLSVVGAHISGTAKEESKPGRWTQYDESELFLDLIDQGHLDVTHLIDRVVEPRQANRVYEELVTNRVPVMGLVFDWTRFGPKVVQ